MNVGSLLLIFTFLIIDSSPSANAANILAVPAMDTGSHLLSFMKLLKGLDALGHHVSIVDFANATKQVPLSPNTTVFHFDLPPASITAVDPKDGVGRLWHQLYTTEKFMRKYGEDDRRSGGCSRTTRMS
ncbi:hypothetical protein M3Y99_00745300 [Aphelenchoides fujianensis]|nr:hypothetical protein M3Y99_00745300 [Aphelenchoides fujianensis]